MGSNMRPQEELESLMGALAETTLALDDGGVLIEARDRREDPELAASAVRDLMRAAGKRERQRFLRKAAEEYRRVMARLSTRWVDLPDEPDDRRALLGTLLARNPEMSEAFLTVQHREFSELTDADVESCLAQLAELGLLDEAKKKDD